jgi:hypothetical protein
VLGSIQPQPLPNQADGTLRWPTSRRRIKPDDAHFARTRLLALENTWGGQVLPLPASKPPPRWPGAAGWPPTWTARGCSTLPGVACPPHQPCSSTEALTEHASSSTARSSTTRCWR